MLLTLSVLNLPSTVNVTAGDPLMISLAGSGATNITYSASVTAGGSGLTPTIYSPSATNTVIQIAVHGTTRRHGVFRRHGFHVLRQPHRHDGRRPSISPTW